MVSSLSWLLFSEMVLLKSGLSPVWVLQTVIRYFSKLRRFSATSRVALRRQLGVGWGGGSLRPPQEDVWVALSHSSEDCGWYSWSAIQISLVEGGFDKLLVSWYSWIYRMVQLLEALFRSFTIVLNYISSIVFLLCVILPSQLFSIQKKVYALEHLQRKPFKLCSFRTLHFWKP